VWRQRKFFTNTGRHKNVQSDNEALEKKLLRGGVLKAGEVSELLDLDARRRQSKHIKMLGLEVSVGSTGRFFGCIG